MRTGSTVVITYDGSDITRSVVFGSTSFEVQFSAIPGAFEMTVRDESQTIGPFTTGREVTLSIDGTLMFGGYLTQVTRKFAFPVDRTDAEHGGVSSVRSRQWVLRGVDYNILFDKRVLRSSSSLSGSGFLAQLPSFYADRKVGDLIRNDLCPRYLDLDGFDCSSMVEDVAIAVPGASTRTSRGARKKWAWCQQGTLWRKQMEDFTQFNGGIWYIDAQKRLHLHPVESMESRWGFSDVPNHRFVSGSQPGFQGATYGFRDFDATEDGSYIVNDALIWGGSEWAGDSGGTVFARRVNAQSIADHNRWQVAEAHFGEDGYGIQEGVDVRAETIVEGTHSGQGDQLYGLKNPQWQLRLSWFAHGVPEIGGVRDHLVPGQLVTFLLYTFGSDRSHPLIQLLPLRQMRVTFPDLDPEGRGYVRFEGFFGLQPSDPWTLWKYLLKARAKTASTQIASVSNQSERAVFGSFGSFSPAEAPDGVRTLFTIYISTDGVQSPIGYIDGTTAVYRNGILQRNSIDYSESDPAAGEIKFFTPPLATDWIWVQCRTMSA